DVQIGVVNNSGGTLASFQLNGPAFSDIYGFDGDGIGSSPYNGGTNASDTSSGKYGGPRTFFTNIHTGATVSATINFTSGRPADGPPAPFPLGGRPFGLVGVAPRGVPGPDAVVLGGLGVGAGCFLPPWAPPRPPPLPGGPPNPDPPRRDHSALLSQRLKE